MITAIVLAAGGSSRMGLSKELMPFKEKSMIQLIIEALMEAKIDRIVVVTRRELIDHLSNANFEIAINEDGEMISSIKVGFRALSKDGGGCMIVLGDQPGITGDLILRLVKRFDGSRIVSPLCKGRRGHPLIIPVKYAEEILSLDESKTLKDFLKGHEDEIDDVEIEGDCYSFLAM
jgi:molybdenum cofactor cytidylyltransferase